MDLKTSAPVEKYLNIVCTAKDFFKKDCVVETCSKENRMYIL
jgi:hypothetical protein